MIQLSDYYVTPKGEIVNLCSWDNTKIFATVVSISDDDMVEGYCDWYVILNPVIDLPF